MDSRRRAELAGGGPAWAARAVAERPGVRFELVALAALLVLTGAFGRTFSKLELGFSWLHPTEAMILVVAAAALVRTPVREWPASLRRSGTLIPLLILWIWGAVAAVRGLVDWGFTRVLYDIGLIEYSALLALVAIVIRDRSDLLWLCKAIAVAGLLGMAAFALDRWAPLDWEVSSHLRLIQAASGMYIVIYAAWIAARIAANLKVPLWEYAALSAAIALVIIGHARSAWVGLVVALIIVGAFAIPGRRWAVTGSLFALVLLGAALSVGAERTPPLDLPSPSVAASTLSDSIVVSPHANGVKGKPDDSGGRPVEHDDGATGLGELTASFRESEQQTNAQWRLAFWKYMLEESAQRPLFGAGFGTPSNFTWNGVHYDRRTGDPNDPFDVSGPHNSFVNLLYRTGLPGLLALLAILLLAVIRLLPVARRTRGEDRAIAIWLLAALAATTVAASFNVALEGPFMGIFFWGILGLALVAPQFLGGPPEGSNGRSAGVRQPVPRHETARSTGKAMSNATSLHAPQGS